MRRPPGQIRDAIVRYLKARRQPATIAEIHTAVERQLGSPVSASSVRSYLNIATGLHFDRVGRGLYRLRG
jgi:hypothetical protein